MNSAETKTAHTPGPWAIARDPAKLHWAFAQINGPQNLSGNDEPLVVAYVQNMVDSSDEANARLIAAAPELLEALRETSLALKAAVAHAFENEVTDTFLEKMRNFGVRDKIGVRADAAIAKAEGRTS